MCISSKGKGYDPAAIVAEAVKKTGWTPEKFFHSAEAFAGKKNGFNAELAMREFNDKQTGRTEYPPRHMVSSTVVTFADWVLIKDLSVVNARFKSW
jgi:hypothetical protein